MRMLTQAEKREVQGLAIRLAAFALGGWLCLGVVFGIGSMKGGDMHPALEAGDVYFYYRLEKAWHTGDLVCARKNGDTVIGRIAAAEGDTVEISPAGEVIINGSRVVENDIHTPTPPYAGGPDYPLTLAEGELFLLCDERQGGADSRLYGPVRADECRGKLLLILRRNDL